VQADLRGVDTHGINRIPSYMARVRQGVLDPLATPLLTKVTPVVAQVSGPWTNARCVNASILITSQRWTAAMVLVS